MLLGNEVKCNLCARRIDVIISDAWQNTENSENPCKRFKCCSLMTILFGVAQEDPNLNLCCSTKQKKYSAARQ